MSPDARPTRTAQWVVSLQALQALQEHGLLGHTVRMVNTELGRTISHRGHTPGPLRTTRADRVIIFTRQQRKDTP